MRSPQGKDYWNMGVYQEIVPPERLVYTESFTDENGDVVPAPHYGLSPDFPMEMLVTVTFEDIDGQTELTVHHTGIPAGEEYENCHEGWNQTLHKLAEYLAEEDDD